LTRWRRPELLAIGGVILILTAILLGLGVWLAFLVLGSAPAVQATRLVQTAGPAPVNPGLDPSSLAPVAPPATHTPRPAIPPRPTSAVDIERLLAEMSLEEKIGQMIMTGVAGPAFNAQTASLIETYHFGSVVYFAQNAQDPAQTLALSQGLQQAAANSGQGVPLIIAIDHEGGSVFRFAQGLTHFPSPMALGAAGSPDLAYQAAAASARELLAVGVNTSLAPVLDVNDEPLNPVIGVRAFSGYPDPAAQLGAAYLRGLQENGVIAAAKHYPGHGSTIEDSHVTLPIVNKDRLQLAQSDLVPFQAAIQNQAGLILVGHVAYPQVDPSGEPATLSPVLVEHLLRGELGYAGVVMTDAMSMGAITNRYTTQEAALKAVQAGVDLLAYPEAEMAIAARQAILAGVQDGSIRPSRIDESAGRVLRLKQRYGLFDAQIAPPLATHPDLARQVAERGIAFSGRGQAPLVREGRLLLVSPSALPSGGQAGDNLSYLGELLQERGIEVEEWIYSVEDAGQAATVQAQVEQALPGHAQAVMVLWDALLARSEQGSLAQINLLEAVLASGTPAVVVAASSPFDLDLLPAGQPALASFGGLDYQIEALAEALLAQSLPPGRQPAPINR
jgi:beta-N-acetylhexosaminidase